MRPDHHTKEASMNIRSLHAWNPTPKEAVRIQESLSHRIVLGPLACTVRLVAGIDVSFSKKTKTGWAGIVVFTYPELQTIEKKWSAGKVEFPYIPGLLSFREIPLILKALKGLKTDPDLFLCDGQGIAHPRGMGLASHLGLLIDKPTIGCAKKRLVGEYGEIYEQKGAISPLHYKGREVGAVVRTRAGVKPVFISPGYKVGVEEAVGTILQCAQRYRIPEPLRRAHTLVTLLRQE